MTTTTPEATSPSCLVKIYVRPMTTPQIRKSMELRLGAERAGALWQQVQQTHGLEDQLATPFLLQLVVEVLPQLQGTKLITRSSVYGETVQFIHKSLLEYFAAQTPNVRQLLDTGFPLGYEHRSVERAASSLIEEVH